jgi:hypothetical protein
VLEVARLGRSGVGGAVPGSGRPARGRARFRSAVAGAAVARAREPLRAGRAAARPPGVGGTPGRGGRTGEPGPGSPAGAGPAVTVTAVIPGASAVAWPGADVGLRLPAPPP